MSITGLPDNWPELVAGALAVLPEDEFAVAWQAVGKAVRAGRITAELRPVPWSAEVRG